MSNLPAIHGQIAFFISAIPLCFISILSRIYLLISHYQGQQVLPLNHLYARPTTYIAVHHTYFTVATAASPVCPYNC
jgi:hypothetical protein